MWEFAAKYSHSPKYNGEGPQHGAHVLIMNLGGLILGPSSAPLRGKRPATARAHASNPSIVSEQQQPRLQLSGALVKSISEIGAENWDALHDNSNPFLSYDFLSALEDSGSASPARGWLPQHLAIRNEAAETIACVPLYLKSHSFGEYVFDQAWGEAYDRHFSDPFSTKDYYPKLQVAVPFTPVSGARLLVRPDAPRDQVIKALSGSLASLAGDLDVSSCHVTFNSREEWLALARQGFLRRIGVQYHWHNDASAQHDGGAATGSEATPYASFEDFLAALKQKRRKAIRQERKKVAEAGLRVRRLTGEDVKDPALWDAFYRFYLNTIDRKWGTAYLTREFFDLMSERMADRILLVVAEQDTGLAIAGAAARGGRRARPIAAALNFLGTDAIYGRNWGCEAGDEIKGLHFELCFYQAIEHAIETGMKRVEAGAQGEHKLARGYLPTLTYSSHYIVNEGFRAAIEAFLRQERADLMYYAEAATQQASPYKD